MKVLVEDIVALIGASLDANYSEVRSVSNRIARAISVEDMDGRKDQVCASSQRSSVA
jgi:hypothetical protein